ncbi:MAG: helix-turn-helix domain-containing protein [Enterococcus sp.]
MNYQEIKSLYPSSSLQTTNNHSPDNIVIPVETGFIRIPKKELTAREEELLTLLFGENKIDKEKHSWYSFLFENKAIEQEGDYRVIQIKLSTSDFPLKELWIEEIKQIFQNIVDFFFTSETTAFIVEKESEDYLNTNDLDGLFLALDTDFNVSTKLFVGSFHSSQHKFAEFFSEEQTIFWETATNLKCKDISNVAMAFYSNENIKASVLLSELYTMWLKKSEMCEIIPVLWNNLGNLSSTSKDLYMHRNTLLYKIEKFYSETGLNLKEANALFLGYLLILNFHHS